MPTPYPIELRARVVASIEEEKLSFRDTAERFAVSLRWVVTLLRRWKHEQTLALRPHAGGRGRKIHPAAEGWLTTWLDAEPDLTLEQLCDRLAEHGVEVDRSVISRTLERLGWTRKKLGRQSRLEKALQPPQIGVRLFRGARRRSAGIVRQHRGMTARAGFG